MKDINEIHDIIASIYDWPITKTQTEEVYNNFSELIASDDLETVNFFMELVKFDKNQRRAYRSHLAEMGFELRPDEMNQYILLLMLAIMEAVEV